MPAEVMKDLELWWLREMHHRIGVRCNRNGVITMNFDGEVVVVNIWYKVGEILPRKVAYGNLPCVEVAAAIMN